METIRSFDTSVLTRTTRHNISEDGILEVFYEFLMWVNKIIELLCDMPAPHFWDESS
jgi:hypothetical protein